MTEVQGNIWQSKMVVLDQSETRSPTNQFRARKGDRKQPASLFWQRQKVSRCDRCYSPCLQPKPMGMLHEITHKIGRRRLCKHWQTFTVHIDATSACTHLHNVSLWVAFSNDIKFKNILPAIWHFQHTRAYFLLSWCSTTTHMPHNLECAVNKKWPRVNLTHLTQCDVEWTCKIAVITVCRSLSSIIVSIAQHQLLVWNKDKFSSFSLLLTYHIWTRFDQGLFSDWNDHCR